MFFSWRKPRQRGPKSAPSSRKRRPLRLALDPLEERWCPSVTPIADGAVIPGTFAAGQKLQFTLAVGANNQDDYTEGFAAPAWITSSLSSDSSINAAAVADNGTPLVGDLGQILGPLIYTAHDGESFTLH